MATFFDALGQYATNRVNNMADRFNTATEYFTDPQEALRKRMEEEEEERKRREREQQLITEMEQRRRDEEQAQTPVKQTIVTNPDGTQEMTIKGTPQALSGMNPNTPSVVSPVAPSMTPGSPAMTDPAEQERQRLLREAEERERVSTQPITPVAPQPQPVVVQAPPQPEPRMMPAVFQPGAQPAPQPAPQPAVAPPQVVAQAPTQPLVQQPPMQPRAVVPVTAPEPPPQAPQPIIQAPPAATTAPATAPAPTAAPKPAQVDFSAELSSLVSDPAKLASYYGDTSKPEPARKIAADLFKAHLEGTYSQDRATKTLEAAAQGDRKAQNEVMRDLQREDGSYIKAILFARLGLNKLAEDEQNKLGNLGSTVSRAILGTSPYTVETDRRGAIIRAWDENGSRADEKTLAALNSSAVKQGSQAFGFTSGISTLPSTGEPLQARQNSITGQAEYVYMTGPNRGQIYKGNEVPIQQRVQTQAMVDYNKKLIDFAVNPSIAAATETLKFAVDAFGINSPEVQRTQSQIGRVLGPQALNQIIGSIPQTPAPQAAPAPAQAAPAQATPSAAPAAGGPAVPGAQATPQAAPAQATPSAAPAPVSRQTPTPGAVSSVPRPGESPAAFRQRQSIEKSQAEANIQQRKELNVAEGKPPAEARGKLEAKDINNQAFADSTYGLIRPIADLVKKSTGSGIGAKVDAIAATFGKGTEGAAAIAELEPLVYPILANVPRFEGPQSDYDVKIYKQAAGDFANPEKPIKTRLAALQGMITLLKKYDKEGKNDWTFGESQAGGAGGIKIIKREKIQ